MSKPVVIYSYPSCSSCRQAEAWLRRSGVAFERVHIFEEPPTREALVRMAELAQGGVDDLISRRSVRFRELGLKQKEMSPEEWLDLLASEPRLLRRPLVTDGEHVVVGFNPEGLAQFVAE